MKKKKQKIAFTIIIFTWIIVVVLSSVYFTLVELNRIAEGYYKDIVLNETVVFDESEIVDQFGHSITLNAGMHGTISDPIYYYGVQRTGYEYIETTLYKDNGDNIPILLTFDQGYEKAVLPSDGIVYSTHDKYVLVLDISKIEDADTLLSEYKESRERYYLRIKKTKITGALVGTGVLITGTAFIALVYSKARKKAFDKDGS